MILEQILFKFFGLVHVDVKLLEDSESDLIFCILWCKSGQKHGFMMNFPIFECIEIDPNLAINRGGWKCENEAILAFPVFFRIHSHCENWRFLAQIIVNSHSFALRIYPFFRQMRWQFASIRIARIDRFSLKSLSIRKHSICENRRFLAWIVVNSHSFALQIYPSFCQMRWEFASTRTSKIDRISVKSS